MSFRSSLAVPPWSVKFTNTHMSAADSTTSQEENSNDALVIEDLDLADLDLSPSTVRTCTPSPEEIDPGEYVFYPEMGANNIFGEQIPAVVSEACLMNDLYILVKVPTNPMNHVPTSTTASQTTPKSLSPNLYFSNNRTIFAIEEEEEHSIQEPNSRIPVRRRTISKKPCWVKHSDELEEFASTTSITRCNDAVPLPNQVPEEPEQSEEPLIEISPKNEPSPPQCQNQIEMQEVSLNSFAFKGPGKVSLENYGILITPTKTPRTENLLVFQVDTEPKDKSQTKSPSCFDWITKLFCRKRRENGFVHAKVYKTYFVKWKKCPQDSQCPGCQCRTSKNLRRNST